MCITTLGQVIYISKNQFNYLQQRLLCRESAKMTSASFSGFCIFLTYSESEYQEEKKWGWGFSVRGSKHLLDSSDDNPWALVLTGLFLTAVRKQ